MTIQHEGKNRFEYHIRARGFTRQSYAGHSYAAKLIVKFGDSDNFTVYERRGKLSPLTPYDIMLLGTEFDKRGTFFVGYVKKRSLLIGPFLGRFVGKFSRKYMGRLDGDTGEPLDDGARKILQV